MDPDLLASSEASRSGSTVFSQKDKAGLILVRVKTNSIKGFQRRPFI